jgi:hypothetical protein
VVAKSTSNSKNTTYSVFQDQSASPGDAFDFFLVIRFVVDAQSLGFPALAQHGSGVAYICHVKY